MPSPAGQQERSRVSYGASQSAGNVYYQWPAFLPQVGVLVTRFPVSIFDVNLKDYEAYDSGRLPFRVDVHAFMRIARSLPSFPTRRSSDLTLADEAEPLRGVFIR